MKLLKSLASGEVNIFTPMNYSAKLEKMLTRIGKMYDLLT